MATIHSYPFIKHLRSEASSHIIRYRAGRTAQSGRGLAFWFRAERASIAELPMDDRGMSLFVKGRSQDFQEVSAQGVVLWHVDDPERLASRIDFTINLHSGDYQSEPLDRIEARLSGIADQAAQQHLSEASVRKLLDQGTEPLRSMVEEALRNSPALLEIGIGIVGVQIGRLTPSSELERALRTPTFEALQQKADEATFERRALAVEKERAIAENELTSKTELARREKLLIAEEAENARNRAAGQAEAKQIEATSEAERIRVIEAAGAEAERAHIDVYRNLAPSVLLGLAVRDLAGKLNSIEHVTITPDLLSSFIREFKNFTSLTVSGMEGMRGTTTSAGRSNSELKAQTAPQDEK